MNKAAEDEAAQRQNEVRAMVNEILAMEPLFLDTETTGLDYTSEIIEIGIVDVNGITVFESLVRPKRKIPGDAVRIHGITDDDVANAPDWPMIHDRVASIIEGRHLIIYNANYDMQMLDQTVKQYKKLKAPRFETWCAMNAYARFYGEWDDYRESWRWQKLVNAAQQMGITLPATGQAHRAVYDCLLCRGVVLAMAG